MAGDVEAPQPTQPTDAQQRHEAQMLGYVLGLFFFYVLHDALQERAFRTPGFEFGWFMTAVEIGTMFVCALAWEGGLAALRRRRDKAWTPAVGEPCEGRYKAGEDGPSRRTAWYSGKRQRA